MTQKFSVTLSNVIMYKSKKVFLSLGREHFLHGNGIKAFSNTLKRLKSGGHKVGSLKVLRCFKAALNSFKALNALIKKPLLSCKKLLKRPFYGRHF